MLFRAWSEMRNVSLVALATLFIVSCALPVIPLVAKYASPNAGAGLVTVERGHTITSIAHVPHVIFIDGEAVATLADGKAMNMYLPYGRHIVGVALEGKRFPTEPVVELAVDVSATENPIMMVWDRAGGYGGLGIKRVRPGE